MANKPKRQQFLDSWWARMLIGLIYLALAYGFASLAIDSGSLVEYAIALGFIYWAIVHLVRGARHAFSS